MGLCQSNLTPEEKLDRDRSKKIDSDMRKIQDNELKARKVLLLGTGESGKSTLFRQSKMLFGSGFDQDDMETFKSIITGNIVDGMKELCENIDPQAISNVDESFRYFVEQDDNDFPERVTPEMASHVKALWSHKVIRQAFDERHVKRLKVQDNFRHFFDQIDRIQDPRYQPTIDDILMLRAATTGVVELALNYNEQQIILLDVGGQRNERKKWIHQFDRCKAVLFVAAISEYDQVIQEDQETNRLQEALDLFGEICNLPFFQRTHLMLFLNKRDLLQEKINLGIDPRQHCPVLFQDFQGPLVYDAFVEYVVQLFAERNAVPERNVYCHITCATDPSNVRQVFDIVYDILLQDALDGVM